ncbi:MAG: hypothetical protein MK200_08855, partial [Nitrosopumilus sp.]|nr:hypothetical protein [Nitrosopumilus sp.]
QCTYCELWVHIKCNGISVEEYKELQQRNNDNPELIEDEPWCCITCTIKNREDFVPFIKMSSYELLNMNNLDTMELLNLLPAEEITTEALSANQLMANDLDEDNVENINCKYYTCEEFYNTDNTNSFNITHSNVNGLICHADHLHEFLRHSHKTAFDVICISETSLTSDETIPENSQLNTHKKTFTTNTETSKGGVAIFTKNEHDAFERDDLKVKTKEYEAVWIEINNKGKKNTIVGCMYRHPHANNIDDFSTYVNKCLTRLNKESKEVYIAGDFNIDLLKYESNAKYREFYNLMTSNGYLPLIIQPTRITDTTQSLIDNIYTNSFVQENKSGNILLEIADHLTQFVSIQKQDQNLKSETFYKRDDSNWKENLYLDDLSIQNWDITSQDPNARFTDLLLRFEGCINRHLPYKKITKKELKIKKKPWITTIILRKMKHRDKLFARKKKDPDNDHLKSTYNRFRNSVNRDIKTSKKEYYSRYFEKCKTNMKKTWKGINELISNNRKSPLSISQINHNKSIINDPDQIANTFNNFFVNVGRNVD